MMHLEVAPQMNVVSNYLQVNKAPDARTVLEELFVLLEDYAPVWYTEEHHKRALDALLERQG
jgi:hypothetical protein